MFIPITQTAVKSSIQSITEDPGKCLFFGILPKALSYCTNLNSPTIAST